MYAIDAGLSDALALATHVACARITVLEADLATVRRVFDLDERIVLSGNVTAELRRDVRRSATLQLVNADGSLSPALSDDLLANGSPVVIERGALVGDASVYAPLMTGFVTGCTAAMTGTIDLTVESYMSALAQDAGTALVLPAGTFIVDALHALWDPVLPGVTWVVDFGSAERSLGSDIPVLATDNRLDVGLAMADSLGVDVFDDRIGRIVVRLRPDLQAQETTRVMTEPLALSRTIGRTPVNGQGVEATPGNAEAFYVLEEVDDQASPIHKDRIGLRLAPTIRSDAIPDPDTARAAARAGLAERALMQDSLSVTQHPQHLDLDEGDITERSETVTATSGRYVIDAITYPVGPGDLSTSELSVVSLFVDAS